MCVCVFLFFFCSHEVPTSVRYGSDICDKEKQFQEKRMPFIFNAMKAVLGDRGPKEMDEVQNSQLLLHHIIYFIRYP